MEKKLGSTLRCVAIEFVVSTLFIFTSVDAAVSANHCLEGCHANSGASRRLMSAACPSPTLNVQVSLATGFAASVANGVTFRPKGGPCDGHFGCHFNPAVTLAMALRGKLQPRSAAAIIVSQLFASVFAAALVTAMVGKTCLEQDFLMMSEDMSSAASRILLQAILTLLIILVPLWSHERQGFMGVPVLVGFSYIAVSLVGLQQLGQDLPNLLRSFGLFIIGVRNWGCVWTTLVGSLCGAVIAVALDLCLLSPEDSETADVEHSEDEEEQEDGGA